jgi:hypothetical protein
MRPRDLEPIRAPLELLVRAGAVALADGLAWLVRIGAAWPAEGGEWLVADGDWLVASLPARDGRDLLRKAALGDPGYRCHVDVQVASVLQAVARDGRWQRFEEVLSGPFRDFAPRFVQLLEWAAERSGRRTQELDEQAWEALAAEAAGEAAETFHDWDAQLWGDVAGGARARFGVFTEFYAPLAGRAVAVHAEAEGLDAAEADLLALLIARAGEGEGLMLREEWTAPCERLRRRGLPVRSWPRAPGASGAVIGLVGAVRLVRRGPSPLPADGMPVLAARGGIRSGRVAYAERDCPRLPQEGLWSVAERNTPLWGCLGLDLSAGRWPHAGEVLPVPEGAQVPGLESLRAVSRPRSQSADADEALHLLGRHLVFGTLLQLFLIEALDRELGHETLTIAAPPGLPGESEPLARVLYGPPSEGENTGEDRLAVHDLGAFEEVVGGLARGLGVEAVPLAYEGEGHGPWSAALWLLRAAGVVCRERGRLQLAPEAVDRFHGGGLMSGLLRRGRGLRRRLHQALRGLWEQANRRAQSREAEHV